MIGEQTDIIKDLLNSIRVMSDIIETKQLTEQESFKVKYVTKTITQLTDQLKSDLKTDRHFFIINNGNEDEVIGRVTFTADSGQWSVEWYNIPSGQFTINKITDKAGIIAFSLVPVAL